MYLIYRQLNDDKQLVAEVQNRPDSYIMDLIEIDSLHNIEADNYIATVKSDDLFGERIVYNATKNDVKISVFSKIVHYIDSKIERYLLK